jgi:proline iminopeptidase
LIPGSDLRIFEESSHSIRGDETERLLDAIAGFVVYKTRG